VISKFEPQKDYGIKIAPQHTKCLTVLTKNNDEFSPGDIIKKIPSDFLRSGKPNYTRTQVLVSTTVKIAKQLNLVNEIKEDGMTFDDFCEMETVQYYKEQLRGMKQKHMETTRQGKIGGTQKLYLYKLWRFSNWLHGQNFQFKKIKQVDIDIYKKVEVTMPLENVEHFLKIYQDSTDNTPEFVRMIKRYLLSENHKDKRSATSILQGSKGNNIKETQRTLHLDSGNYYLQTKKQRILQKDILSV